MRVIIEVDNDHELERALDILKAKAFKDKDIHIVKARPDRQAILQQIYDRYQITLPKDWKFDREATHER